MAAPNRNYVWADLLIDELARSGVRAVCIAPGSRSTPLTLAFAAHPDVTVYRHLDERSAGFFALGLARATGNPVALVCTSGSAVVNFFPAIVEAHESRIPLIVLTGDRPPELRDSGANQTIDQVKIFGGYALWSLDLALPEGDPAPLTLRYLRTTAARAAALARGATGGRRGVVHLNVPFRKPLEPMVVTGDRVALPAMAGDSPTTAFAVPIPVSLSDADMQVLYSLIRPNLRGVIVCGPNCPGGRFPDAVRALARHVAYPIFAEPSSGVRYRKAYAVWTGYETYLNDMGVPPADLVIRFGDVPTSRWLNEYLDQSGAAGYIQVSADGVWTDDLHRTTHFIHADPEDVCVRLLAERDVRHESLWYGAFLNLEVAAWAAIESALENDDFDAAYVYDLIAYVPAGAQLFVGNSLSIRHVDQFGKDRSVPLYVTANRGASGIDGNISTALGIAAAHPDVPVVMLVGDITLIHDMNGLFALKDQAMRNVTIVLMNNDGGGIFHRLPIQGYEPAFTDLFIMPHGLDFQHAAALYGLEYIRATDRAHFRSLIAGSGMDGARLIEIRTETPHDETARRAVIRQVRAHLAELNVFTKLTT